MKYLALLLYCFLLVGCFSPSSDEEKPDDVVTDSLNLSSTVLLNADSTVQIYLDTLPFLYSWKLFREGEELERCWNKVYLDTNKATSDTKYTIALVDDKDELVIEKDFTPSIYEKQSDIGMMYPHKETKLVIGTDQQIRWNSSSFPTDEIYLQLYYIERRTSRDYHIALPNTGSATIPIRTEYYENLMPGDGSYYIDFWMYPKGHSKSSPYTYKALGVEIEHCNYKEFLTYPLMEDTLKVGNTSYVTWNKDDLDVSQLTFSFKRKDISNVHTMENVPNTGEYVWTVPNVESGFYHFKVDYGDNKTLISYPVYVKR